MKAHSTMCYNLLVMCLLVIIFCKYWYKCSSHYDAGSASVMYVQCMSCKTKSQVLQLTHVCLCAGDTVSSFQFMENVAIKIPSSGRELVLLLGLDGLRLMPLRSVVLLILYNS